jgi:hypothetical protein
LILFVMAALGFAIILKKDAPESVAPKKRPDQPSRTSKRSPMKPKLDQNGAGTNVVVNERQHDQIR